MTAFHKIWIEQCEAAREIKEKFGCWKALGYLIGEKLVSFVRASDQDPAFAAELPNFCARTRELFDPNELRYYFDEVNRLGPMGHIASDDEAEFVRKFDMIEDDPVRDAEDALIIERIKEMLLD